MPQKYRRPWLPASGSCDGASTALGGQIDIPVKSPTSPALLIKLHLHVARGHGIGAPADPGHHDQSAQARFIVRTIIKTTCFSPSTIPKTQQKTATNSISPGNESNKKSCHEHGAPPRMLPQEPQPCLARWTEPTDYKHLFSIVPTGRTKTASKIQGRCYVFPVPCFFSLLTFYPSLLLVSFHLSLFILRIFNSPYTVRSYHFIILFIDRDIRRKKKNFFYQITKPTNTRTKDQHISLLHIFL